MIWEANLLRTTNLCSNRIKMINSTISTDLLQMIIKYFPCNIKALVRVAIEVIRPRQNKTSPVETGLETMVQLNSRKNSHSLRILIRELCPSRALNQSPTLQTCKFLTQETTFKDKTLHHWSQILTFTIPRINQPCFLRLKTSTTCQKTLARLCQQDFSRQNLSPKASSLLLPHLLPAEVWCLRSKSTVLDHLSQWPA
jgi:hypothetical protein